jgi:capsular polysaccharide biosynthesis protein
MWRNGYHLYVNFFDAHLFNRKVKRWRPLTKLREYTKKWEIPTYKLTDAASIETPVPRVFPACDQSYLVSPHDRYEFPEIFVAAINNAVIYGGTNLVLADGEVICHDLYDFKRDYTSEEVHSRTLIDPKSRRIRWLLNDEAPETIPVVATFIDACALNYAHWMTEVLPRVVLFCAEERFKGVPIVVNDGLHKNIMESLFLVVGTEREIITLPIGRALAVSELYVTSVAGYVPFERRTNKLSGHSHGMFSPLAFEILRNHLTALGQKAEEEAWPAKIFLRRNSGIRKISNAAELEKLLIARGYVIVEPEKLTFSQQVQLFSNAKTIIGSSGAALANIVFASQNAKIFILIGKYLDISYWYWQNMACVSGKTVSYVFGKINTSQSIGIHADFMVDLDDLVSSIDGEER